MNLSSLASVSLAPLPSMPHFFAFSSADELGIALQRPYRFFLETGPSTPGDHAIEALVHSFNDFSLSLTTQTACRIPVACAIAGHLEQRFALSESKRAAIQTCLQEAIVNAALHGNLELRNRFASEGALEMHYIAVKARLNALPYKNRRIAITARSGKDALILCVTDEGAGLSALPPARLPADTIACGRGLFMIRSLADRVWLAGQGRSLCMSFKP